MKFKATIMALLVAVSALGQTRQRIITDTTDLTRRLLTNETAIGFLNAIGGTTNGGISSGPAGVAPRDNSVTMVTNAFSVIQVQVTPGAVLNNTVTNATGISGAATNVVQAIASSEADAAAAAATNALPYFSAGTNVTVRTVSGASGTTNFIDVAKATGVMRVISPVAPENGDTNWFGPWTPGTVTAGIQEAINSLPISATGSSPGGGLIFFKPGRFDTTTNIHFPATLGSTPYSLTFKGSGMLASGIVGIFTRAQTVLTVGKPQSKTPYTFVMEDMFIASNTNACTNIITLAGASDSGGVNGGGIARAAIRGCFIGFWGSMTNNPCFSGNTLTPSSCADSVKHNLVAIDVDLNYNDPVSITENSFSYVNCAIAWACDHGVIGDNTFEHCGNTASLSDWPNTSPFYTGATIVFREPSGGLWNGNKDWRIRGNNFVNCPLHYLNTLPASAGYYRDINNPNIYDDTDESGSVLAATTGAPITFVNPKGYYFITNSSGITVHGALARYAVPNSANYSTWNTVAAPGNPLGGTNVIAIIDLRRGTNTGGMVFGDTVSAPAFVGDGSGLTGISGGQSAAQVAAQISTNGPQLLFARNYGAVGDGSTDNTAALQLAIEAANNQTNGSKAGWSAGRTTLVLEAGHYKTTSPLYIYGKNGLEIRGLGGPGQCIVSNGNTSLMVITNAANGVEPNNLILDNIAFRSTGYSQTGLLFCATVNTMDNMVVKNCSLYGFKTAMMMYSDNTLGGVSNSRLDNVDLFDNWYGLIVTNGLYNANRIEGTFVNNYAAAFVLDKGTWDIYMRDAGGTDAGNGYTTTNILWITGTPKVQLRGGQCEYFGWTNKAAIWATGTGGYKLLVDSVTINAYSDSTAWAGATWSVALEDTGASTSFVHFQNCDFQPTFRKTNYTANFAMPGSPMVRITSQDQRVTASGAQRVVGAFFQSGVFVTNSIIQQDPTVVVNNAANLVGAGNVFWGYKQWMLTNGVPKLFMVTADGLVQVDSRGISTSFASLSLSNSFTGSNWFNGDVVFASAKKTRFLTDGSTGVRLQATAASRGVSWIANTFNTHDWGFFTPTSNDTEPTWNTAAARVYHDTANNRTHVGYNAVGSTAPYGTATLTVYGSYGGQTSAAPASVVAPVKWMTFVETNGSSYRIPLYQ